MPYDRSKVSDYPVNPYYGMIVRVATLCPEEGMSSMPTSNGSSMVKGSAPAYEGMPCIPKKINTNGPASTMKANYGPVKSGGLLSVLISWVNRFFLMIFDSLVWVLTDTRANPIVSLAQFGQGLVYEAGAVFVGIGVAVAALTGATGWIPFVGNATVGAAQVAITWFAPVAAAAIGLTLAFCGVVGYYLPLVPYILFTVGAVSWFMLVIEAMIAGPIIALGVIHPEGQHDIWGRSEKGIMLLLGVFLRPVLMVIGFIAASLMIYIIIALVNGGFSVAFMAEGGVFGPFALFFTLGIYTTILVFLFQRAFSLIYEVPDKALRWIGEAPEQSGDVKESLQKSEQGFDKSSSAAQEAPSHAAQGVKEMGGDNVRQREMAKTIKDMKNEQ
jgi:defect-in-organelle-trafficking protein DotA